MLFLLAFAFLAGFATVLSPCVLPVLPALLAAGTAKGRLRPFGMIIGVVVSFTFFTLALTAIVHTTGLSANALRYAAIALIAFFGLVMIFPNLSNWFSRVTSPIAGWGQQLTPTEATGFGSGFILGGALGLLWTPCAGPILAAVTTLVATQSVTFATVMITLAYSAGSAIPLFVIAYGGSRIVQSSRFLSSHAERIRQAFGGIMILTAAAIALHWDMLLQQQVTNYFPALTIEDNATVKKQLDLLLQDSSPQDNVHPSPAKPGELPILGKAPEFAGIANWINSPPLTMVQLKGKVVLIDFWTYTCINCLRTLPYITKWYQDYKDKGLVIVGVHTPEFEFEKDPQNVKDATKRLGVNYPVAQDNDYKTWSAYHNHYWPAHYLVDQAGNVRMIHFGEGGYAETENGIRELLGMSANSIKEPQKIARRISPETYLGTARGNSYTRENNVKEETAHYDYKKVLLDDEAGLKGQWNIGDERITAEGDDSSLDYNFLAKQVYLVMSGSSPTPMQVYLDGKLYGTVTIDGDRKYDIVNTTYERHQLSLKVPKGISAYAFTFGDE